MVAPFVSPRLANVEATDPVKIARSVRILDQRTPAAFYKSGAIAEGDDAATLILDSGTYTPTLTGVTNVAASTPHPFHFSRLGSTGHAWGKVEIDPTAGATLTELGISLPTSLASDFTAVTDLAGVINHATGAQTGGGVAADTTNNRAQASITPSSNANATWMVSFGWTIL